LPKKLGLREGSRLVVLGAPPGFDDELVPMPEGVQRKRQARGPLDVILYFVNRAAPLHRRLPRLAAALDPAGGLWVAWPKKASGVATDLSFDVVQRAGLDLGLVDNKICAVNEVYSGLRFVVRKENRPPKPRRR
jgi:hypothetical protein